MTNLMTTSGLEKLKSELAQTKEKLKEIALRIKDARDLGDLSENAEYHEAKNEQAFLLGREADLEQKIKAAKVIKGCTGDRVDVGCTVLVESSRGKMSFQIVGSEESDPLKGKISASSPIGSALYGHKEKDTVTITTPAGATEYKILKIEVME